MADMELKARIEFDADTTAAQSGIKAADDAVKQVTEDLDKTAEQARSTAREMENLGDKAETAGGKAQDLGKKAKEAGTSGADGMNLMSTATAAMQGNFAGVASGVAQLTGKIKLLGMSMMQLSLVAAVLTLLVKLFQAIAERAAEMAVGLRAIQSGNVQAAVERISKSYDDMRESSDRASASRDKLFDVNMKELESIKNLELAQIELNKQKELGTAKTDDERAAIEAKYKAAALDKSKHYDTAAAGFQRELLQAKAAESNKAAEDAKQAAADLMGQARRRQAQTSYASSRATEEAQKGLFANFFSGGSHLKKADSFTAEAKEGQADVKGLIAEITALQKTIQDNTEAAQIYAKQADIAGTDAQIAETGYQSSRTAAETDERMRAEQKRAAAEKQRKEEALAAAEQRAAAVERERSETQTRLQNRAQKEQREAAAASTAAAGMRGRSGYGQANRVAGQENREAAAAAQAVASHAAETSRIVKRLEADMKRQRDELRAATRNIPNS